MAQGKQTQPVQFVLRIVHVKMRIKFPCKMALQHHQKLITREVSITDNHKFIFNEEVTFKGEAEGHSFDIYVNLYTEKGTKYTSGVMKLLGGQILRSQGERIIVPLNKCLDPDAFCELKVQDVNFMSRSMLRMSKASSKAMPIQNLGASVELKKNENEKKQQIGQTKSEVNISSKVHLTSIDENKVRQSSKSQIYKTFARSPARKYSNIKHLSAGYPGSFNGIKNMSEFPVEEVASQRPTLAETEVIRQSYQKLKEKYKKESQLAKQETHKRMLLEANENNYKLQVIKLKVKCEGQEKDLGEKNNKIRAISSQLVELQKKDIDLAYLKEENGALLTRIKLHEDTVLNITKDNDMIKKLLTQRTKTKQEAIGSLKNELQLALANIQDQKHESELLGKTKDAIILGKNNDLKQRTETIDRQKKLIKDLEDQTQGKFYDFEKSLTTERNNLENKISEMNAKLTKSELQKVELNNQLKVLRQETQKSKTTYSSLEYSKKLLKEQTVVLNQSIGEYKVVKQKYGQLSKDYKLLEGQFETVKKNLKLSLSNKDVNIKELMSKYDQTKDRHEKSKQDSQQKIKNLILKTHQFELAVQGTKHKLEKAQRVNQNLNKEITFLKKQNSSLRTQLSSAQKRIINYQGEHSLYSSKYERETANLQFINQKLKDNIEILEKEVEAGRQKIDGLIEVKVQFERKQQQWKIRSRHFEQKIQKDVLRFKDTVNKFQGVVKECEATIRYLESQIQNVTKQSTLLKRKINEFQLNDIRNRENEEKTKKEIKLYHQKVNNLQSNLRGKQEDLLLESAQNKQMEIQLTQKDLEIARLKEKVIQEENKIGKSLHMIEILKKQGISFNHHFAQHRKTMESHEQIQGQLRNQLKNCKEELTTEKIRFNKKANQFDKFKDSINDIMKIQFARILKTSPPSTQKTERLRESQASNGQSEKSGSSSRIKCALDASQLTSNLADKLHETKNTFWKIMQLNRAFRQENNKLMQKFELQTNKNEFNKLQLHRDIQLLEDEMNLVVNDKEVESLNYDNLVIDLNFKIKQKQAVIEDLRVEIEECDAIVAGIKTDFDTNNDLNDKKVNTLKANISELNERIQYLSLNVACLQDKNHQLDQKVIEMQNQIISHKELLIKNQKLMLDLRENQEKLIHSFQQVKKENKVIIEIKSDTQIQLNTEKQIKQKYMSMLEEEERKTTKQNQFIANLILQKEAAIKNQLERSEEANNFENKLFELTQQNQLLKDDNQGNKKKMEESRVQVKNLAIQVKRLQKQLSAERSKNNRLQQKVKEKDSDISIKKDYIKDLEEQYRQLRDKNFKQIQELSNELEDKNSSSFSMTKQLTDKLMKIEGQNKKIWQDSIVLKNQNQNLHKLISSKDDEIQDLNISVKKLDQEKVNLMDQMVSKQFMLHERADEIQKLQTIVEEQNVNVDELNHELEAIQQQCDLTSNEMNNQFNHKMQSNFREYEQKLQLAEKQIDFVRDKMMPLEQEVAQSLLSKKTLQIEGQKTRKIFEQKIKKLQNERLTTILSKNNQIKQLSIESKTNLAKMHEKQSQLRKLSLQMEQIKLTTGRTQEYLSYSLEQSKNREKVLSKEIQVMKVKDSHSSNIRQTLLNTLYQNEVEVRKVLASTTKKIMQTCDKSDFERLLVLLKGLQNRVVAVMMAKLDAS